MATRLTSSKAQSTLEWVGLIALVAILMTAMSMAGLAAPAVGIAHSVSKKILCAVALSNGCGDESSLDSAYGSQIAELVRAGTPALYYGRDMLGLPVDYRTCRSAYCAEAAGEGEVSESKAGEPVTLFTRVIDCRDDNAGDCEGGEGNLYLQYWAYYPESASLRGAPVLEQKGYHPHDWESKQVRIGPDGSVRARASSHAGYNHSRSTANWGADMGWGFLNEAAEAAGFRPKGGWGDATGQYLIAGGSHAGNVDDRRGLAAYPSNTPASLIRLVPLESIKDGALSRPANFDPITPPWEKRVWTDPESESTG